ncbi:MAG: hypothetical protein LBI86_12300 [Treponema sp.]|jgi:hypothetical protein|nr:hypothetical protein [Treponema sp.]
MVSKKWKQLPKTIGNLFIDLGKLSFGSLMLGSILKGSLDPFQTFVFGASVATILFVAGIWFTTLTGE